MKPGYPTHYKLDAERRPVPCGALEAMTWRMANESLCCVGLTRINGVEVSHVEIVGRTSTWQQAEAMHAAACRAAS